MTDDGRQYARLFPAGFNARYMPGPPGAKLLRSIWARRVGANRLFQSMENLLGVLLQLGAHKGPIPSPGKFVNAAMDVLAWTLNYLQAYELIERTGDGLVKVTPAGLELAGKLGMIKLAEVPVPAPVVEPSPPPVAEPAPEPPVQEPTPAPVAQQPQITEAAVQEIVVSMLSEKLKPVIQAHLELKAQVAQCQTQLREVVEAVRELGVQVDRDAAATQADLDDARKVQGEFADKIEKRLANVGTAIESRLSATEARFEDLKRPQDHTAAMLEQLVQRLTVSAAPRQEAPPKPPAEPPLILIRSNAACRPVPSERAMVEGMAQRLNDASYKMDLKEVANLYTCVKSGRLTVLAGPPGSGKSTFIRQFAEAIGHKSTLAEIAVRRGWTDDSQFMGAINRLHQRYEPAPTGVVPHLLAAQADPDTGFYWFLLDEFNLSTPEYYFAEFISVLEDQEPRVSLYTPGVSVQNADRYPATIPVGDNIHFFATVNLDDTASFLSPRLIDRANLLWIERQVTPDMLRVAQIKPGGIGPISAQELRTTYTRPAEFAGPTRTWWDQVQQILGSRKDDLGAPHVISPRSMVGLARYVANAPHGVLEPKDGFDLGLAQRILPGVRGFGAGYGQRLQSLQTFAAAQKFTQSAHLLERIIRNGSSRGHEYDFFSCLW
ncbi:MAG TPA: AAA family ATPase [Symbiobacteriaceae bacterium]|nr:AAA family ATPase [Symbiobacteriaceae bacterium]